MKIVINGKFLLASIEGMPRVGRELTIAIDKLITEPKYRNLDIEIVTPRGGLNQINLKNIPILEVGNRQGVLWEQFDFPINVGSAYSLNFTATAPIIKHTGCVVIHDAQFRSAKKSHGWKTFILYNVITPIVSRRYKHIVSVSNYAKNEILKHKVTNRNDIHVIYNGVDHFSKPEFEDDNNIFSKLQIERGQYALTNSYIHHHKNVRTILSAFKDYLPNRKLILFGSTLKSNYEENGVSVPENAIFAGRVTDGELAALLRNASMFIFPSTTEGFGLPPLEAMSLGTPTICSNLGAMPEICAGGALFVDQPYSAPEWAEKIETLWNDENLRAELASNGRSVAERYRWETSARQYLDIIMAAE